MNMAGKGYFQHVFRQGFITLVKSQSVDGARILLYSDSPYVGKVVVKLLAPVFADYFMYTCLTSGSEIKPSLMQLLNLPREEPPEDHVLEGADIRNCQSARTLSKPQTAVIQQILSSLQPIHTIWSIAGGGKTRVLASLVELWGRQQKTLDNNEMAWVMVPRQLLRMDLFIEMKANFNDGYAIVVRA